jgi:hypothetical protein
MIIKREMQFVCVSLFYFNLLWTYYYIINIKSNKQILAGARSEGFDSLVSTNFKLNIMRDYSKIRSAVYFFSLTLVGGETVLITAKNLSHAVNVADRITKGAWTHFEDEYVFVRNEDIVQ